MGQGGGSRDPGRAGQCKPGGAPRLFVSAQGAPPRTAVPAPAGGGVGAGRARLSPTILGLWGAGPRARGGGASFVRAGPRAAPRVMAARCGTGPRAAGMAPDRGVPRGGGRGPPRGGGRG